jgi:predicted transcriptional regulator YdeE
MAEIVNVYRQAVPAVKFIGKKYSDEDRVDGSFGACWQLWFQQQWFNVIDEAAGGTQRISELYEDANACLGYMRYKQGEPFQYWIGKCVPLSAETPEGFEAIELAAAELGVCWVKGKEPYIYCQEEKCGQKLVDQGMEIVQDEQQAFWFFERYSSPRFTERDEDGNVVLDICHYVRPAL